MKNFSFSYYKAQNEFDQWVIDKPRFINITA